jgi:CRISPR-associated endonuclease/helicase Cas3
MAILHWIGKTAPDQNSPSHPAAYHMLDVAAVAEQLVAPFEFSPDLRDALVLLVALHDLGKLSDSFQAMLKGQPHNGVRHWELTEVLLHLNNAVLARHLGGTPALRRELYASTAGHHGRPPQMQVWSIDDLGAGETSGALPKLTKGMLRQKAHIGSALEDAAELVAAFCALWPHASLRDVDRARAVQLSWWLPGFCAVADWVGSNVDWFAPSAPEYSLPEYLALARTRAAFSVAEAGLGTAMPKPDPLFDFAPRPMQAACADIALPDGPMLAIIEDETGAGKTEAALLLAQRMALAGKGRGLYFALPTMATADAMFARAQKVIGGIFAATTLTLAHGRAGLSMPFQKLIAQTPARADDPSCTDWLASSRRRALLAGVGIGTIDQALLSALPVKHQTLRHFGLSSKILIVDEVHDMGQPYVATILRSLLAMHRAAGGSAILLTATLPLDLRRDLLASYGGQADDPAYPALTIAQGAAVTRFASDPRPSKGPVAVLRLETVDAALEIVTHSAAKGAACAWVRNSVDEAIEAVAALRARGIAADLLHARFAFCDRKAAEDRVLARVGKDGLGRAGYVLVATQVIQASLDLDFDVMISDLAPIAELIQRAGRLWRHMDKRPAYRRPIPAPVLNVLSPDPDDVSTPRWLQSVLQGGAWVYPVADAWRTARVLFRVGEIAAPQGLRALIEAVHGDGAEDVPAELTEAEMQAMGKDLAERALSTQNVVDLSAGYRAGARWANDATYPTRLGPPSQTLILARLGQDGLHPWAGGEGADAWALSEVSAAKHRLDKLTLPDQSAPAIAAITKDWPDWRRDSALICAVGEDGVICEGLRYDGELGLRFG